GSIRFHKIMVIPNKEFNKLNYKGYNIEKGSYIRVVQDNIKDEVNKEEDKEKSLFIGGRTFYNKENIFNIVINTIRNLGNEFIVVNDEDYMSIKNGEFNLGEGRIHVLNFKHWKETKPVVNELNKILYKYNNDNNSENKYIKINDSSRYISSKVQAYDYNKQGGGLILYLVTFIGIFFFISICVVLFLRLFSDIQSDKETYRKLYKIGIRDEEIRKYISKEIKIIFFIPLIIGILIALIYTSVFYKGSDLYLYGLISTLIISIIYIIFQSIYYFVCKEIYIKEILKDI
ncbi:hypothetical protein, partial [Clostridium sp.]|uniref:hypothetical protein n=1 Tax=Clostridium sp. TaxID=1506 RepID=UPI00346450E9